VTLKVDQLAMAPFNKPHITHFPLVVFVSLGRRHLVKA